MENQPPYNQNCHTIATYWSPVDPISGVAYLSECDRDRKVEFTYEMFTYNNSDNVSLQMSIDSNVNIVLQLAEIDVGFVFAL